MKLDYHDSIGVGFLTFDSGHTVTIKGSREFAERYAESFKREAGSVEDHELREGCKMR